jgi:hypothetical protein
VRGRCRRRCSEDDIPDPFDVLQDFMVSKAKHTVAALYQPTISGHVLIAFRVLTAIDFDHEPLFSTNKIDDIWPDGFLANKFKSCKAIVSADIAKVFVQLE